MRGLLRKRVLVPVLAVLVVAAAVGLWAFQPWKVFTRSTIEEAAPTVAAAAPTTPGAPAPPPGPRELAAGTFVSAEHETRGTARVLDLGGGSRVLRLENFGTSDGPDLYIWLTDIPAGGEWGAYDDGRAVKLGKMKATDGNQNYEIPPDASLTGLRSVVVWCDRFNVAFGTAPLTL